MTEIDLYEESPGIHRVDLRWMGVPGQVAAYLVDGGADGFAVVETGPASTLPTLLAAVRALGRDPADITHVLVTHVHLDHAGGAGLLLEHAPRARVHVHPVGAPHLADPSRLLASAARIYGDRMDEMWGEMRPVPKDRLVILADGDEVRIGERILRAVETPGHAWHHHAYHDPEARVVITGDSAGIRMGGAPHVRPPTPPPDIDVARWQRTIDRLRSLRAERLLLTHFGGASDVDWHLADLSARLADWARWIERQAAADPAAVTEALRRKLEAEVLAAMGSSETAAAYEQAVPSAMMAAGLLRWLKVRDRAPA